MPLFLIGNNISNKQQCIQIQESTKVTQTAHKLLSKSLLSVEVAQAMNPNKIFTKQAFNST